MTTSIVLTLSLALAPSALDGGSHGPAACSASSIPQVVQIDAQVNAEVGVRYAVAGTTYSVCVEYAMYPYSERRGHRLDVVVDTYEGTAEAHYSVLANERYIQGPDGLRVDFGMARFNGYSTYPDVWFKVSRASSAH